MGLGALGSGYCYKSGLGMFTILEMVFGIGIKFRALVRYWADGLVIWFVRVWVWL